MNINLKNKNLILIVLLTFGVIINLNLERIKTVRMLNHPKFTIGMITSKYHHKTTFGSDGNDFIYFVNSQKFTGVANFCAKKEIGDKFIVIYDSIKVSKISKLLCNYPIPDS